MDFVNDYMNENSDNQHNLNVDRLLTHATDKVMELAKSSLGQQVRKIKLVEVTNYIANLPPDFVRIDEIAYKTDEYHEHHHHKIISDIYGVHVKKDGGCKIKCPELCDPCAECDKSFIEIDITPRVSDEYLHSYIQNRGAYGEGISTYHHGFKLLYANVSPYAMKHYHIPSCNNLSCDSKKSYEINYPNIVTNFKSGLLLIAYWGLRLNADEVPMILNTPYTVETINYYLDEKLMWNEWRRTRGKAEYELHLALRQLRLESQRLAKKELTPFDIKVVWEEAKKHFRTRAGRPYDGFPFTQS